MTEYQKISSFADIVGHTEPGTLIAFDCDDTLLRITGDLSCKSWWSDKYAKYLEIHKCTKKAFEFTLSDWTDVATNSPCVHTDEDGLITLIEEARDAKNPVIIVTARNFNLIDLTHRQLTELNIKMDDIGSDKDFDNYHNGIFYNTNKGTTLLNICSKLGISNLIFIDDNYDNLCDVDKICSPHLSSLQIYHASFD